MTRSEFLRALADEFGDALGHTVARDVILGELGNRSANEALDAGVEPREVWSALCEAMDVPLPRRHGVGLRTPPSEG
jgi:hypothetical protein